MRLKFANFSIFKYGNPQHPSTVRLPPLHPTTLLGDTMKSMPPHGSVVCAQNFSQSLFAVLGFSGRSTSLSASTCVIYVNSRLVHSHFYYHPACRSLYFSFGLKSVTSCRSSETCRTQQNSVLMVAWALVYLSIIKLQTFFAESEAYILLVLSRWEDYYGAFGLPQPTSISASLVGMSGSLTGAQPQVPRIFGFTELVAWMWSCGRRGI